MAVPDFQSFFKPPLAVAADGKEHSMKEAREIIAKRMSIADADLREMLPSGTQTKFGAVLSGQRAINALDPVQVSERHAMFA